jgi:CelD/BcsL family acetyltransferase involved in cellulose biosynthesis
VIAIELDLRAGDRLAFYQAGRRIEREWRGCGSVLRADLIDWACEQGLDEYDLLRGDEPYKADWSDRRRELVRCRVGVGPLGRTVDAGTRANVRIAPTLQRARRAVSPGSWRRRRATRDELSD